MMFYAIRIALRFAPKHNLIKERLSGLNYYLIVVFFRRHPELFFKK